MNELRSGENAPKRRRRGHGEGAVYKRKDGRWMAVLDQGFRGAKRIRKSFYGRTKREALDKLADGRSKVAHGIPIPDGRLTVGAFLDIWLRDLVKPNKPPTTYKAYETKVRVHLKPALGHLKLATLGPRDVQEYIATAQGAGSSAKTARDARAVLSVALSQAERWGLVARNAAKLAEPPKTEAREIVPLDLDGAKAFLDAIRGHRLEALFRVALSLGIREGEVLGLRWRDIDLDNRFVRIRVQLQLNEQTRVLELVELKSSRSRRSINLPDFAVRTLREHRTRQLEERLKAGEAWHDWQGAGLVFTDELGGAIPARNMLRIFDKLRTAAELPELRFHDTRHTCATFLLLQGVSERVVMEILGHSNLAMTQRYAHVLPPLRQDAAERLDEALRLADRGAP